MISVCRSKHKSEKVNLSQTSHKALTNLSQTSHKGDRKRI